MPTHQKFYRFPPEPHELEVPIIKVNAVKIAAVVKGNDCPWVKCMVFRPINVDSLAARVLP